MCYSLVMDKKTFSKKYLKIVSIMFFALLVLSLILVFGVSASKLSTVSWGTWQKLAVAAGCTYLPCASFTGFCVCFAKVKQFNKAGIVMLCVLFPITLALVTAVGILAQIPAVFYTAYIALKSEK